MKERNVFETPHVKHEDDGKMGIIRMNSF